MPDINITIDTPVSRSMRCRQVESMFDVPPAERQTLTWTGALPIDERPWNVGLIVGPSGSGKTTIAKHLFGDILHRERAWTGASVLDDFPAATSLSDIADICQAVGFNTIPAWLRPYNVLSNGEQFRASLARMLAERNALDVVDEFTSVVDRQVAKIGAHAVQKYVRRRGSQFVAVSCHADIIDWLNPDWIFEPATMTFAWRLLQRRPTIDVDIQRVDFAAWKLFAPFHYLTRDLHQTAQCFALFVDQQPAAFAGLIFRPSTSDKNTWGLSRLVTLPDFQGLGLAFVLSDAIASALAACNCYMHSYPAHPALIRAFDRSPHWTMRKKPGLRDVSTGSGSRARAAFGGRPNAVFRYVGPAMDDAARARAFLAFPSLTPADL